MQPVYFCFAQVSWEAQVLLMSVLKVVHAQSVQSSILLGQIPWQYQDTVLVVKEELDLLFKQIWCVKIARM